MHLAVLLFFSNLFSTDMILIVIVALVLFGGDKLPEIARTLGKGLRDFKEASDGVKREINNQIYAYEEKKQDQKLDEIAKSHQEAQEKPKEITADNYTPVPNTLPYSEGTYTETPAAPAESVIPEEHPVAENITSENIGTEHPEAEHIIPEHPETPEVKNS